MMTRFVSWIGWGAAACAADRGAGRRPRADPRASADRADDRPAQRRDLRQPRQRRHPAARRHQPADRRFRPGRGPAPSGDRIEDVDGLPAPTVEAFNRDVASGSYGDVDLRVQRGAALLDIHVKR